MIYEVNIENAKEGNGKVVLDRLVHLSKGLIDISFGALQLRILGASKKRKGRQSISFNDALEIKLVGLKKDSTAILLECDQFPNSIQPQLSLFGEDEKLSLSTPMSIVMDSFKMAFDEPEGVYIDKHLLGQLKAFKHSLYSRDEVITIMNQGSIDPLQLTADKLNRIKEIEEDIPRPRKLMVTGLIEQLSFSQYKGKIKTNDGIINSYISSNIQPEEVAKYWGKEVTAIGTLHYGLNNSKSFEIERLSEPDEGSDIFRTIPPRQFALEDAISSRKKGNPLVKWEGQWPGDESIDDILKHL